MSTDPLAWVPLEDEVRLIESAQKTAATAQGAVRRLSIADISALLLIWLVELCEDYRQGDRFVKINTFRHVARSGQRDACMYLGGNFWDIEAALRHFYADAREIFPAPVDEAAFSSQGAKLRRSEVDCPICACSYSEAAHPVLTQCCFQSICARCTRGIIEAQDAAGEMQRRMFRCPFCRCTTDVGLYTKISV
eukprot:gnl/TRDRNA2_/TRDRNA2_45053_c0_seq2.p1 gnl/TRDRNA2_/TRDRNA2_45053_c0~~gnl/TRDRNA2_/TRDRNA2_45053_c0_seq2.p1  ORF type:complete len:193 (+),score=24.82 gnl/TRDRNA2_/TRDRNA2_45053_c0_seq2:614-1192(+)